MFSINWIKDQDREGTYNKVEKNTKGMAAYKENESKSTLEPTKVKYNVNYLITIQSIPD